MKGKTIMENTSKFFDLNIKLHNLANACSMLAEALTILRDELPDGGEIRGRASDLYHEVNDRLITSWNEGINLLAEEGDPRDWGMDAEELAETLRATYHGDWYNEDGGIKDMARELRKQLGL